MSVRMGTRVFASACLSLFLLLSQSLSPSLPAPVCFCLCLSMPVCLSVCLSDWLAVHPSVCARAHGLRVARALYALLLCCCCRQWWRLCFGCSVVGVGYCVATAACRCAHGCRGCYCFACVCVLSCSSCSGASGVRATPEGGLTGRACARGFRSPARVTPRLSSLTLLCLHVESCRALALAHERVLAWSAI